MVCLYGGLSKNYTLKISTVDQVIPTIPSSQTPKLILLSINQIISLTKFISKNWTNQFLEEKMIYFKNCIY